MKGGAWLAGQKIAVSSGEASKGSRMADERVSMNSGMRSWARKRV
jgi:hypothetical protein